MLGNFTAVKILNSEVVDDLKKESTTDVSAIIGIKSETKNDIRWELTSSYGQNRVFV